MPKPRVAPYRMGLPLRVPGEEPRKPTDSETRKKFIEDTQKRMDALAKAGYASFYEDGIAMLPLAHAARGRRPRGGRETLKISCRMSVKVFLRPGQAGFPLQCFLPSGKHTVDMNKKEKYAVAAVSAAIIAVVLWRAIPDSPKVRIGGNRIHHGLVGALLVGLGVLSKRWEVAAAGTVLAVDDIDDLSQWLDFRERGSVHNGVI